MNQTRSNLMGASSIILTFIATQILSVIGTVLLINQDPSYSIIATIIINLAGAFFALWLNHHFNITYSFELEKTSTANIVKWGITGVVMAFAAQILATMIEITLFGEPPISANTESIMAIIDSSALFILLPIVSAPIIEELVFRKAINGFLVDKIGWVGGAVISSLAFAFVHFDGMILTYATIGLVFSYVYYKTNSIWAPMIAHMGMNLVAVILNMIQ